MTTIERDPSSAANIDQVITTHIHLNVRAHFDRSVLAGSVDLSLEAVADGVDTVVLDGRDLSIKSAAIGDAALDFATAENGELGQSVTITLKNSLSKGEKAVLRINYETSPDATGLQWLPPAQTEGKQQPYLFSQFQAIHARSALPCMDTPANKQPYTARVEVPKPLTALMSALSKDSESVDDEWQAFTFEQRVPIPSYLIAIVAGLLESREIGPRSRVWAEASVVEKAAYEFAETEEFLKTAEALLTPYEWGRYDLLCLPSSFPYGGMENPCLTFVTPTLLAGDRSLSSVVAHEIAHSWTGNLVTNRTWEHFWLNEGFTVFVERKIIGRLYGESERQFRSIVGNKQLQDAVDLYGADSPWTALLHRLGGTDPDVAFSSVPYERGSQFLFFLEHTVGGAEAFEPFLREWVKQNSFKTVTTEQFKSVFLNFFGDKLDDKAKASIDWDAWFSRPGMPPVDVPSMFDDTKAKASEALATKWIDGECDSASDIEGWQTTQIVHFLEKIVLDSAAGLPADKLKKMDELYGFGKSQNTEIRYRWLNLCLVSKYTPAFDNVVELLGEQGRMKFVRPLFRLLNECGDEGKQVAKEAFAKFKDQYNNIAKKMVAKDIGAEL